MSFWNAKIMQMSLAAGVYLNAISGDYVGKNGWAEGGTAAGEVCTRAAVEIMRVITNCRRN